MKAGVHAVAVVDDAERVIGILTTSDVIQGLLHGPPRRDRPATRGARQPQTRTRAGACASTARSRRRTSIARPCARPRRCTSRSAIRSYLGKTLLYLDQRRRLEKVLELADRFLLSGQEVQVHALLLKAIHAAKRAEEHATGKARVPFPLE